MQKFKKKKFKKNSEQKKYFDKIADKYFEGVKKHVEFLNRLKTVSSPYISGKVLDVGNGGIVSFDYKKAKSITLADIAFDLLKNPKAIEKGTLKDLKVKKLKAVKANIMSLPFPDNFFDVVIVFNVLHHLSVSSLSDTINNIETAFKEINRVLKKDGVFLLSDNCPPPFIKLFFDPLFELSFFMLSRFNIPLPYFLSSRQIELICQKTNFQISKRQKVKLGKKVYQPLLPMFTPPGWLWDMLLGDIFFVIRKDKYFSG